MAKIDDGGPVNDTDLLTWFAGQAMMGYLAAYGNTLLRDNLIKWSWQTAEAMIHEWWDFVSYPPPPNDDGERLPPLKIRVVPDGWTSELAVSLEMFWTDYQAALGRIKSLKGD